MGPAPLVRLLDLSDPLAWPDAPRRRGRPLRSGERVLLTAVVLRVLRQLPSVQALLALVAEPEMAAGRARLCDGQGHFPSRRTGERRRQREPAGLPASSAALGRQRAARWPGWEEDGRAVALDSRPLPARGKPGHPRDRRAGRRPDTRLDAEAPWTHAGWHGGVDGDQLHVVVTLCPQAPVWLPLAAAVTPANGADSPQAPLLLDDLAPLVLPGLFVLADSADQDPDQRARCARAARVLVASRRGTPARDDGTTVRQVVHALRAQAIESGNAQFTHGFALGAQLPTRGLVATQRMVLGAVFVDHLLLLDRFLAGRSLRGGLQAALHAA